MKMPENTRDFQVYLIGGDKDKTATISCLRLGDVCRLSLRFRDQTLCAEALDYFETFCKVRLELEKLGLIPFCYGASLNVYPSGMGRDMGSGLVAYKLTRGSRTSSQDLVQIFEQGPDVIPASVSLQKAFWLEWLASCGLPIPAAS
jgi:hypothetical protein